MNKSFKRYLSTIVISLAFIAFIVFFPAWRDKAVTSIFFQTKTMLLVIPPIFILLGLFDVWIPREKMTRYMGTGSGFKGTGLAFLLGSFAAGPLYGAFPFAAVLMKKGASFTNILIFIGAWSTTKIPMLLFEMAALGKRFALSRLAIDIVGIIIIAGAIKLAVPKKEMTRLYDQAEQID
ncbi:MAG: permease [Spirochaetes bacterium GWD1_61_31]|nr:MAG: permease [Spirochaetes bacterium GWB1_60_80]OHD35545.1 MAG: permease [Spirochaetes bacterium GWD1_61_31]OHD57922.1 MAG: permease [Spirochaetes bacterium GWF1_60_12]